MSGTVRLGALCLLLGLIVFGPGVTPLASDTPRAWIQVDNHTLNKVQVHFAEHGGHSYRHMGKVGSGKAKTFKIRGCGQEVQLRATDKHHGSWETRLHTHCGETALAHVPIAEIGREI